jgi:hypothetical protein
MIPFIAGAVSAVVSVVSSIGPAVAGFCANVLPKLGPLLAQGLEALKVVAQIVDTIALFFGIFKGEETTENVGDRAIQAAEQGITPERFDDFAQYMDALREFKLDDDKSQKIPVEQKIVAGFALAGRGLDDKFNTPEGTMGNMIPLIAANPLYFSAEKLTQFLKSGHDIGSIIGYFEGKLGGGEALETEDKLVNMTKSTAPEADEKSIREQIYSSADAVQRYQS